MDAQGGRGETMLLISPSRACLGGHGQRPVAAGGGETARCEPHPFGEAG